MRNILAIALLTAAGLAISAASCGGNGDTSSGTEGGSAGTTTSDTTTTTNTHTTTSITTTSTSMMDCTNLLNGTACANCVEAQCCDKINECLAEPACAACLNEPTLSCEKNEAYGSVLACGQALCANDCTTFQCDVPSDKPSGGTCVKLGGPIACNFITNDPCPAGDACAFDGQGFSCQPVMDSAGLCGECGGNNKQCDPGQVCFDIGCGSICCTDADCGMGQCIKGAFDPFGLPDVGYCGQAPIQIPCDGPADGVCDPEKEVCGCADCDGTALCNKDQCQDNGTCDVFDSCTCPDCDDAASCICNYDGECDSFKENCKCPDCWTHPSCADNPHDKCVNDGKCDPIEFCSCADCVMTLGCNDPNHCTEDGMCQAYEGCICNDCMMEPGCMMASSGSGP